MCLSTWYFLLLLAFIDDLRLDCTISGDLLDEQGHPAMIALDHHARGEVRIAREIYGIFAFWAYAEHIHGFEVVMKHTGKDS